MESLQRPVLRLGNEGTNSLGSTCELNWDCRVQHRLFALCQEGVKLLGKGSRGEVGYAAIQELPKAEVAYQDNVNVQGAGQAFVPAPYQVRLTPEKAAPSVGTFTASCTFALQHLTMFVVIWVIFPVTPRFRDCLD